MRTNIWSHSPKFSRGFMKMMVDACYAPPEDGAKTVIHAATVPWEKERKTSEGSPLLPHADLRWATCIIAVVNDVDRRSQWCA